MTARVAVVDVGSNTTRLLVADVDAATGAVTELERASTVTRLGQGVDRTGRLAPEAVARVHAAVSSYASAIDARRPDAALAILTSAVRDAADGAAFAAQLGARHHLETRILSGDEEARLTFRGATAARASTDRRRLAVIDVGGGSTEVVIGVAGSAPDLHVSTQAGVVRQSERFIHHDPPRDAELRALAAQARELFAAALPDAARHAVDGALAVAGTATTCAAILLELEPYDRARVAGFRLSVAQCERLLARLAALTDAERRTVPGLHPERAPVIVAGIVLLIEALRTLGLDEAEVSEDNILTGAALERGDGTGEG